MLFCCNATPAPCNPLKVQVALLLVCGCYSGRTCFPGKVNNLLYRLPLKGANQWNKLLTIPTQSSITRISGEVRWITSSECLPSKGVPATLPLGYTLADWSHEGLQPNSRIGWDLGGFKNTREQWRRSFCWLILLEPKWPGRSMRSIYSCIIHV